MPKRRPIGRISYRDDASTASFPVKSAWKRLRRWMEDHAHCEDMIDDPPATEDELRVFETAIGAKLPADVRASFRLYNGQCAGLGVAYGIRVQSLKDCLNHWTHWSKGYELNFKARDFDLLCTSFPADFVSPVYFNRGWIPLTSDSGGNHIGVDLNPGPKGTRGQVIVFGRNDEFHSVLALCWGQFLTDLADELEAGNFRLDTADPEYPELAPDDPHTHHFHSVGIYWSRGKLGLRKLGAADRRSWNVYHGMQ